MSATGDFTESELELIREVAADPDTAAGLERLTEMFGATSYRLAAAAALADRIRDGEELLRTTEIGR